MGSLTSVQLATALPELLETLVAGQRPAESPT